jgi:hypothetical protein
VSLIYLFASKFGWSKSDTGICTLQELADLIQLDAETQAKIKAEQAARS